MVLDCIDSWSLHPYLLLYQFHGANLALSSNVDYDTFGKMTKHNKHDSQEVCPFLAGDNEATYLKKQINPK